MGLGASNWEGEFSEWSSRMAKKKKSIQCNKFENLEDVLLTWST